MIDHILGWTEAVCDRIGRIDPHPSIFWITFRHAVVATVVIVPQRVLEARDQCFRLEALLGDVSE